MSGSHGSATQTTGALQCRKCNGTQRFPYTAPGGRPPKGDCGPNCSGRVSAPLLKRFCRGVCSKCIRYVYSMYKDGKSGVKMTGRHDGCKGKCGKLCLETTDDPHRARQVFFNAQHDSGAASEAACMLFENNLTHVSLCVHILRRNSIDFCWKWKCCWCEWST